MGDDGEPDPAAMLNETKKKKKKKSKTKKTSSKSGETKEGAEEGADDSYMTEQRKRLAEQTEFFDTTYPDEYDRKADYTYSDLLDRVVEILHSNNPDLIEKKRRNM